MRDRRRLDAFKAIELLRVLRAARLGLALVGWCRPGSAGSDEQLTGKIVQVWAELARRGRIDWALASEEDEGMDADEKNCGFPGCGQPMRRDGLCMTHLCVLAGEGHGRDRGDDYEKAAEAVRHFHARQGETNEANKAAEPAREDEAMGKSSVPCGACGRSFSTMGGLRHHKTVAHKGQPAETTDGRAVRGGHQPEASTGPEGNNPPSGGSNVVGKIPWLARPDAVEGGSSAAMELMAILSRVRVLLGLELAVTALPQGLLLAANGKMVLVAPTGDIREAKLMLE